MSILIEISASKKVTMRDTNNFAWKGTGDVTWRDQDDPETLFLSLDGVALNHFWDAYIFSFSSPQYSTATDYGGFA